MMERTKFLNIYKTLLIQIVLLMLIYQLNRLLFFTINHVHFSEVSFFEYVSISISAIRFDLSAICSVNLLYIILFLLPFSFVNKRWYQSCLNILFIFTNSLAFLFDLADIGYFPYVRKRMTADVFELIGKKSDFIDLLPSYIKTFWFVPLAMVLMIVAFAYFNKKFTGRISEKAGNKFNVVTVVLFLVTIGVTIITIRGGVQLKPILNTNARLVTTNENTPLVLNTPFSILHSFEQTKIKPLHYFSEGEMLTYINPIKKYTSTEKTKDCNVVLILLESFGKGFTGIGGRKSHTPFLDSLMKQGLVFTNAYANAHRSSDGIPACIAGIPACMEEAFITSPYANNKIDALPSLLKKVGYSSSFFHGGTNGTMSFDIFSKSAGFDKYVGRSEYNNDKDYDGTWGIWDEPFLQFYAKQLNNERQPFFSSVFTLSSHEPFALPSSYSQSYFAKLKGIDRGVSYTDMALRKFFESAQKSSWYNNTLFVIAPDHNFLAYNDPLGYYNSGLGLYSIPVIFYAPFDTNLKGENHEIFQQIDILPTVMDYLHYPESFFAYGSSAFDTSAKRFVYTQMNDHIQMLYNGYVAVSDNECVNGLYFYQTDSTLKSNLFSDSTKRVHEPILMAFRQLLTNSIIDDRQTVSTFQHKR